MICYIEHDISVNKQVHKLSDIGRILVKNLSYDLPKDCWVDFKDWRTLPKRWKLERDTSKSHLYTETYSFYDTVEKTTKTVKVHNPYNELFGSGKRYLPWSGYTDPLPKEYKISINNDKLKKELTIVDDKNILKSFYYDMNAIYFWSDIAKNGIDPTRGGWMIMRKCSLTGPG